MKGLTNVIFIAVAGCLLVHQDAHGQEPGWTSGVIKVGNDRTQSRNTHILHRPYRPLHFYGNTVRRMHYKNRMLPSLQELRTTVQMLTPSENNIATPPARLPGPTPAFAPAPTLAPAPSGTPSPPIGAAPDALGPSHSIPASSQGADESNEAYEGFRVRESSLSNPLTATQ